MGIAIIRHFDMRLFQHMPGDMKMTFRISARSLMHNFNIKKIRRKVKTLRDLLCMLYPGLWRDIDHLKIKLEDGTILTLSSNRKVALDRRFLKPSWDYTLTITPSNSKLLESFNGRIRESDLYEDESPFGRTFYDDLEMGFDRPFRFSINFMKCHRRVIRHSFDLNESKRKRPS